MPGDPLFINATAGAPSYSANELRQGLALGVMYDGRNLGGRQGVRPGGNQLSVSLAGSTITVQPGLAYVDPALTAPQGGYWVALPAAENPGPLQAADATNPRKDIVILRVYDNDEDSSGLRTARSEYIAGIAAPSPAEPAVPAGAMRLATIDVPASPGAAVVTNNFRFEVAPGGILPVRAAGDVAAAVAGRYRHRLDTGDLEVDTGSAWVPATRRRLASTNGSSALGVVAEVVVATLTANLINGHTYHIWGLVGASDTVTGDVLSVRIREDNLAGTLLRGLVRNYTVLGSGAVGYEIESEYDAIATVSKSFVVTIARPVGTGTVNTSSTQSRFTLDHIVS